MVSENKTYYCLRCQHRFSARHEAGSTVERSCPKCGSNSVRLETAAAARRQEDGETARGG